MTNVSRVSDVRLERELLWRSWFPENATLDDRMVIPDDEVEQLLAGFEAFCSEMKIKVPGARVSFQLRQAQRETIHDWIKYRNCVCLKARQIGFSTLTAAFALWCAIGGTDRQIYLLSKKEDASVSLLNKAKYMWKSLPQWVRDRAPALLDRKSLAMTFENESFIQSSPTGSDPIRGETAFLVVCDEWASFPNPEDTWASIEPTADIGGRVIGLSTAKGEGNFFHRLYVNAEANENSFHAVFHPWSAVPERDEEWYERKKRDLEPWQLAQEYPANPEEAFVGSGNPFFDLDVLRSMVPREPVWKGSIVYSREYKYVTHENESGLFQVWSTPKAGVGYAVGADIAQGLEHGDWSVAYVMEKESGDIVAKWRGKIAPDEFAEVLAAIGWYYNGALLAPEANNHGRSTIDILRRLGYKSIYRRRTKLKSGGDSPTDTIGWLTTRVTKFDVCIQLAQWLREHNVADRDTVQELKQFRQEQKGDHVKLEGSPHDDQVMALAIAVEARKYAVERRITSLKPDQVHGTIAWHLKNMGLGKKDSRRMKSRI